jgi:large subunit ribosomal protein L4e
MKTKLINKSGAAGKEVVLPKNFDGKIRADILAKVFESERMMAMQPYGSKIGAGAGYSASGISIKKRHAWKGTYGKGISRVPRKIMSRNGSSFNWVGATVSSAVGGRRAHPPRAEENRFKKINKKEYILAINSALSGTVDVKSLEKKYSTKITNDLPVVVSSDVLEMKTKEFRELMKKIFGENFEKIWKRKTVRAGIGKLRGRKYKSNAGMIFVLGKEEKMNRKGIEVVKVEDLDVIKLSPNGVAGRFAVYTENAIKEIGEKFK